MLWWGISLERPVEGERGYLSTVPGRSLSDQILILGGNTNVSFVFANTCSRPIQSPVELVHWALPQSMKWMGLEADCLSVNSRSWNAWECISTPPRPVIVHGVMLSCRDNVNFYLDFCRFLTVSVVWVLKYLTTLFCLYVLGVRGIDWNDDK